MYGEVRCAVTFGSTSILVIWYVISGNCEPVLSGNAALQLGIIQSNKNPETFQPLRVINNEIVNKEKMQDILAQYPHNFSGLGKLKGYTVKLHVNKEIKPVKVPSHSFPYHLQERAQKVIYKMIADGVIEEHPLDEPALWVSNAVLAPKDDGTLRVTLDARNVNKAIFSSNHPIPKHEDIKTRLSGSRIFSKMDFKSAFWQIELTEESKFLAVFHANGKLYRYKRLTMGLAPSQGELNSAIQPIFSHIKHAHVIHDDVIIATSTMEEHEMILNESMKAIAESGLTLNPAKCFIGM